MPNTIDLSSVLSQLSSGEHYEAQVVESQHRVRSGESLSAIATRYGTSVNAIPARAMMEVDLRSTADSELQRLEAFFRRAMKDGVDAENATRRAGDLPLKLDLDLIGERPTGETASDSPLVQLAIEATEVLGVEPRLDQSSTDSNLPISLGIPAITLGAGGNSGGSHSLDEWYDPRNREIGLKRGLLVVLGTVGLKE